MNVRQWNAAKRANDYPDAQACPLRAGTAGRHLDKPRIVASNCPDRPTPEAEHPVTLFRCTERNRFHHPLRLVAAGTLLAATLMLGGCAETLMGGAAAAGVGAVQERGLEQAVVDSRIHTELDYKWLKYNKDVFAALDSAVYEGRVLVTGVVKTEAERDMAIKLAWQVSGVKEVINEIIVDPSGKTGTYARDLWITAQLKTDILTDKDVAAVNYSIITVRHVVYLFGVARNKAELDRVINYARNTEYVERVVNHVLLASDTRRKK